MSYQSKYTFCMHTRTTRRRFRLQRQTFSILRSCWRPYWISRLAIIYVNLCGQFQNLQTIGNILIYDTSCCTCVCVCVCGGVSRLPLERVASFTHYRPTIITTSSQGRCIDVEVTLYKRHVPTGKSLEISNRRCFLSLTSPWYCHIYYFLPNLSVVNRI